MSTTKEARNAEIVHLYTEEERTTTEIARMYGLTHERVRQLLLKAGVEERHYGMRKRVMFVDSMREAHERIMEGRSTVESESENFSIKPNSLRRNFTRLGFHPIGRVAQHGSKSFYQHHRCRCDECRAANTAYMRTLVGKEPPQHGTMSGYQNYRCRCIDCRRAASEWRREKKRQRIKEQEI